MSGPRATLRRPRVASQVPAIRRRAEAWGRSAGVDGARLDDLLLVVTELATNAVLHGSGATFDVELAVEERRVVVTVRDAGSARRTPRPRDRVARGRGLALVAAVTADLDVTTGGAGTVATAVLA